MDDKIIASFGLSDPQNQSIIANLPTKEYELTVLKTYADAISAKCAALIVNANTLSQDEYEILTSYYTEVAAGLYETIFWIGKLPPKPLQKCLICYSTFEELEPRIKYHLLDANRRYKRSKAFSEKLADSLRILSEIRKKPKIKTKELSEIVGRPARTVQRYINALVATGEWIEYDHVTNGWYLAYGKSLLFGDPFVDITKTEE